MGTPSCYRSDCDFCRIARGEDTSVEIVCEADSWLAFFPLNPATPGHTLVIPRRHVSDLWHVESILGSKLMAAVIKVGRAIDAALTPQGMNLITSAGETAEQTVFHLHLHVVPRWHTDGFGRIWPTDRRYENTELEDVANQIRSACAKLLQICCQAKHSGSYDLGGMVAYLTVAQARARSRIGSPNSRIAEHEIRKSASASMDAVFDVFLSHAFKDAEIINGVKGFIEDQGLRVYVDWIEDPQADRSRVTPATADMLRRRMNHCQSLLYASTDAATQSKWMPWELGYFDGKKPGRIGIVPILQQAGELFQGQEYLGLYPHVELINFRAMGQFLGQDIDAQTALLLKSAIKESFR